MHRVRHFVAGTDFSESAGQALELAIELASAAAARITLVHVCEPGVDDLDDRRLRECGEALAEVVAAHRRGHAGLAGVLRCGKPWEKLDNVAAEAGAGLIVVGRHGAGRGRSVEMGSVADHLVRCASRPVLTVPWDPTRLDVEAFVANQACRRRKES
jgi:nucleotide-binding universal stress UspA family protein